MELPEDINTIYNFDHKTLRGLTILRSKYVSLGDDFFVMKTISKDKKIIGTGDNHEAKIMSNIHHKNIVKMIMYAVDEKNEYLVLEKLDGNLRNYHVFKDYFFTSEESYCYLQQMASALAYLHKKDIIHHDVKPENILINLNNRYDEDSEYHIIKLCDFGFSLKIEEAEKYRGVYGTTDFVSPESIKETNPISSICNDVWSLGCCYFEWITGTTPFHRSLISDTYKAITNDEPDYKDCSDDQQLLLKYMLNKDPEKRITSKLLNFYVNNSDSDKMNVNIVKSLTGGDKIQTRVLFLPFEWYTRDQKYETHNFKSFEDIWKICNLSECNEEEFELDKEGYVSFRSDEWVRFPDNSKNLNVKFLNYCKTTSHKEETVFPWKRSD
jgi:serine/threonine protein kinase